MALPYPKTVIIRHAKENLKKCSLRGLEGRADMLFLRYPQPVLPPLHGYILLTIDAPILSAGDAEHGLLLLDATWKRAEKMLAYVAKVPGLIPRSLPSHYRTAYPRRQEDCSDPERGLASIEALYIAYHLLGRDTSGLLDNYHWADKFLELNLFHQ